MIEALPVEYRLDTLAYEKQNLIRQALSKTLASIPEQPSFITVDTELLLTPQYFWTTGRDEISALTNHFIEPTIDTSKRRTKVGRETACFSYDLARLLLDETPTIALGSYLAHKQEAENFCAEIIDDVSEYLEDSPNLMALLNEFMPKVEVNIGFNYVAENVGGLMLMAIDLGTLEKHKNQKNKPVAFGYYPN